MTLLETFALLLGLTAVFGWINARYLMLPRASALVFTGLVVSLLLVGADYVFPRDDIHRAIVEAILRVDFSEVVMKGVLAFVLFAGALEIDLGALEERAVPIAILAFAGTALSTVVIGGAFWAASTVVGTPISLAWALVLGALVSPTDPIAVLSVLRGLAIPKRLEIELQGEALLNDGVGIVLFTFLLGIATASGGESNLSNVLLLGAREVGGGVLLGLAAGYAAYRAMHAIDDFAIEVLITLALVTGAYALALAIEVSGPLAVVSAGLLMGGRGKRDAMSQRTEHYVSALWTLIDEILNSLLFFLIGLEVLVARLGETSVMQALIAIPVALLGRFLAVSAPLLIPGVARSLSAHNVPFLTWAGIRGGISVALALSLPDSEAKPIILAATYAIVLFAILVQASTLRTLARLTLPSVAAAKPPASQSSVFRD
ncbi:MAG: cation:proton antiporter [Hyphomicrobiaceae bacterium]